MSYIYCEDKLTGEVYEANRAMILATIRSEFKCNETEAEKLMLNADIENPLHVRNELVWAE